MTALVARVLLAAVVGVLLWGAVTDVRTARIPNRLVLGGLVLSFMAALAQGGLPGLGGAVAAAGVAFVVGFGGFALGAIGGGDAKFLMVGAGVVGWSGLLPFLLATGVLGGAVAVTVVVVRRAGVEATVMTADLMKSIATLGRKGHRARLGDGERIAVPYGVAIAAGALVVLFTPFSGWVLG